MIVLEFHIINLRVPGSKKTEKHHVDNNFNVILDPF